MVVTEAELRPVTIYIGDVFATPQPTMIKTVLGSCVAVCLWDPETRVGGMNHFLLPDSVSDATADPARFGANAMDLLLCEMQKAGADRRRLRAKVFGGARVLAVPEEADGVPARNITSALDFLRRHGFPITGEDLGGCRARRVHFHTDSGRAFVQRITSATALRRVTAAEQRTLAARPEYGEITLF